MCFCVLQYRIVYCIVYTVKCSSNSGTIYMSRVTIDLSPHFLVDPYQTLRVIAGLKFYIKNGIHWFSVLMKRIYNLFSDFKDMSSDIQ